MTTVTDRVSRAREALRHAELRTGARSMQVQVQVPGRSTAAANRDARPGHGRAGHPDQIGRASCRERVCNGV